MGNEFLPVHNEFPEVPLLLGLLTLGLLCELGPTIIPPFPISSDIYTVCHHWSRGHRRSSNNLYKQPPHFSPLEISSHGVPKSTEPSENPRVVPFAWNPQQGLQFSRQQPHRQMDAGTFLRSLKFLSQSLSPTPLDAHDGMVPLFRG